MNYCKISICQNDVKAQMNFSIDHRKNDTVRDPKLLPNLVSLLQFLGEILENIPTPGIYLESPAILKHVCEHLGEK